MILFNALKHHLGYIQTFIQNHDLDTAKEQLLSIGASQMDLYIGEFSVQDIENQIVAHLNKNNVLDKTLFENFLFNASVSNNRSPISLFQYIEYCMSISFS